ncbi:Hypothetical protein POVR1_LOCUS262 [uncultured virus]|nr:Hypothetical protein POVR1_LOCUS262 [uncultured virus]
MATSIDHGELPSNSVDQLCLDQVFQYFALINGDAQSSNPIAPIHTAFQSAEDAFATTKEIARILAEDGIIPPIQFVRVNPPPPIDNSTDDLADDSIDDLINDLSPFDPLVRVRHIHPSCRWLLGHYDEVFGSGTMKLS